MKKMIILLLGAMLVLACKPQPIESIRETQHVQDKEETVKALANNTQQTRNDIHNQQKKFSQSLMINGEKFRFLSGANKLTKGAILLNIKIGQAAKTTGAIIVTTQQKPQLHSLDLLGISVIAKHTYKLVYSAQADLYLHYLNLLKNKKFEQVELELIYQGMPRPNAAETI